MAMSVVKSAHPPRLK